MGVANGEYARFFICCCIFIIPAPVALFSYSLRLLIDTLHPLTAMGCIAQHLPWNERGLRAAIRAQE